MDPMNYWRLCDEFNVTQAALLIVGKDPATHEQYVNSWEHHEQPDGYRAAWHALVGAIRSGRLKANLVFATTSATVASSVRDLDAVAMIRTQFDAPNNQTVVKAIEPLRPEDSAVSYWLITQEPDWSKTTIGRFEIADWLEARGIETSFFAPVSGKNSRPAYLDRSDPRYAPKLAASVGAWIATKDVNLEGRSAKKVLTKWLNEHADDFGLCDEDGVPNKTGIDECAKVANWQPEGGAPKTSG